ncbi:MULTISPECIES: energy-coupled thiamine transporter ThiT [unclassified Romboutsia]|uniref:energy-coupled thiamine transporter ThiT n=1 Tax=unclassified Romboutsia TaxID=2626894 RepID=UPI000820F059|nr:MULTISPECIES: energy-coupled thiamine transporter ThiT [unclassified Romboutsia]SCG98961.1 Thiamine ECF transporter S component ThiT [uncultured Clostridium sp.]
MVNTIMLIICLIPIAYYLLNIKKIKLDTKTMIVVSLFAACSFILSKIKLIQYPQGGGIELLSSVPILMIGLLYGPITGMTCGLITGILGLIGSAYIIHPAQFLLDYILPTMLLGLSGLFDCNKKRNIFIGCILAVLLKQLSHILSGCIYFADYAWEGWNPVAYSIVYNLSGTGLEGLLSSIVLVTMPLSKIKRMANIQTITKEHLEESYDK